MLILKKQIVTQKPYQKKKNNRTMQRTWKTIERTWNYIFYSTWKLNIRVGELLIEAPFIFLVNKVPFLRERWKKGEKAYHEFIKNKEFGTDIFFSYSLMLMTTFLLYLIIYMHVCHFFQICEEIGDYFFIIAIVLAWLQNEFLLWRKDVYLKYFDEFDKNKKSSLMIYLPAILFHLGVYIYIFLQ